jgi:hypothetical protein
MNSSFGTTAARHPQPLFKPFLASELLKSQLSTRASVAPRTFNRKILGLAELTR